MAILPTVPGLKAVVKINGQAAHEYDDPAASDGTGQDPPVKTCYIESIAGARFSIRVKATGKCNIPETKRLCVKVSIDGRHIKKLKGIIRGAASGSNTQSVHLFNVRTLGTQPGTAIYKDFVFSASTTDDDNRHSPNMLGTIEVEVSHAHWEETGKITPKPRRTELEVSEKSIKGTGATHVTSLRPSKVCEWEIPCRKPYELTKMGHFIFVYRSKSTLQNMFIIPRTLTPGREIVAELSESNPDEMRRLAGQMPEIKRERQEREVGNDGASSSDRFKAEEDNEASFTDKHRPKRIKREIDSSA